MIDPFTSTRYHQSLRLETWFPSGVLNHKMAAQIVAYLTFEERVLDEPFDRFADLSLISRIELDASDVSQLARERLDSYEGPKVKSAFVGSTLATYGIARMFAAMMEPSPIDVRVFREIHEAAAWLRVPVESLRANNAP